MNADALLVEGFVVGTVDENFAKEKEKESIVQVERRKKEERKKGREKALESCVSDEGKFLFFLF